MSKPLSHIKTIDWVCGNRFHVYLNTKTNTYHCWDEKTGTTRSLRVTPNPKRSSEFIRFSYHEKGKRKYYHKTITKIRWDLYREWGKGNKPLVGMSDHDIRDILRIHLEDGGTISTLTQLKHSKNELVRKAHLWIERNGGKQKFYEVTKGLDIDPSLYLFDRQQNLLKSSFEFITFAVLDHNDIDYQYEPFRVHRYIPDFFIPDSNLIIEILGLGTRWKYNEKSKNKSTLYHEKGFAYLPVHVDGKKPLESIYRALSSQYESIALPELTYYYQKFAKNYPQYLSHLRTLLEEVVALNKGTKDFEKKHRSLYNHCIERWGSIYEATKELVGHPFGLSRPSGYWDKLENAQYELEMVWREFKRIPSNTEAQKGIAERYGLRSFYQYYGGDAVFKTDGPFCDFIAGLKIRYGYCDIHEAQSIASRKEHLRLLQEVFRGNLTVTGPNSLLETHRSTYNWAIEHYSSVFDAIKAECGYPPPVVRRPNGYYRSRYNIEYELRHLWPKWLCVPEHSEVNGSNGAKWTWNSLFASVGREAFLEGGVHSALVSELKREFGFRDKNAEKQSAFHSRFMEYLEGVNSGEHQVGGRSGSLGDFQKYADYAVANYGSVFEAITSLIGRPHHWVKRPRGYYDSLANCKQEIEWAKTDFDRLPKFSDCKANRKNLIGLLGVYERFKSKAFKPNGIFYDLVKDWS